MRAPCPVCTRRIRSASAPIAVIPCDHVIGGTPWWRRRTDAGIVTGVGSAHRPVTPVLARTSVAVPSRLFNGPVSPNALLSASNHRRLISCSFSE